MFCRSIKQRDNGAAWVKLPRGTNFIIYLISYYWSSQILPHSATQRTWRDAIYGQLGLFFTNPHTPNRNVLTADLLRKGAGWLDTECRSSQHAKRSVLLAIAQLMLHFMGSFMKMADPTVVIEPDANMQTLTHTPQLYFAQKSQSYTN
jgi:hypothetical protein